MGEGCAGGGIEREVSWREGREGVEARWSGVCGGVETG